MVGMEPQSADREVCQADAVFGRIGHSKRAQLIARAPTRACMVLVFVGLACLSLFNVALFALRIGLGA